MLESEPLVLLKFSEPYFDIYSIFSNNFGLKRPKKDPDWPNIRGEKKICTVCLIVLILILKCSFQKSRIGM